MIKGYISGNRADVTEREPLTSGTVGKVINFAFTEDWRLLIKYAVFEGSCRRIALTNIGDSCIIPHEVLAKHGGALRVGVYGRTADGSAATPTVYAQLGIIQRGADPNADPSTKPTLPVWAQIQAQIGDLSNLTTEDKTNLVAAINEAAKSGGGSGGGKDGTSYDITAPKGAKGDKGDAGGKGAPGKAAYQYAVEGGYTGTEAEFAAKLAQEKFVNPNALTFTGAVTGSYDGSAPLSVEIPSGGGSGGSAELQLLAEGTLTEDAASIDVDGFSAERIALAVAPYGSAANSGNVKGLFTFGFSDDSSININMNMDFVTNAATKSWNKHIFYLTVNVMCLTF